MSLEKEREHSLSPNWGGIKKQRKKMTDAGLKSYHYLSGSGVWKSSRRRHFGSLKMKDFPRTQNRSKILTNA